MHRGVGLSYVSRGDSFRYYEAMWTQVLSWLVSVCVLVLLFYYVSR